MTVVVPCKEYKDDMNGKIWMNFCLHIFVVAHETAVLAKYKESLNEHKCVALEVFAENYSVGSGYSAMVSLVH
jgi:hypothetical protein